MNAWARRIVRGQDGSPQERMVYRTNPPPPVTGVQSAVRVMTEEERRAAQLVADHPFLMQLVPRRRGERSTQELMRVEPCPEQPRTSVL